MPTSRKTLCPSEGGWIIPEPAASKLMRQNEAGLAWIITHATHYEIACGKDDDEISIVICPRNGRRPHWAKFPFDDLTDAEIEKYGV